MHIKKLEICGFKSFVDRTVIHFDHDVIGIVGPNGCGKSNIVDAIRWCMGEQSPRHLRGKAMEDVIFNGSESRGPHGFAEVTLTFDNSDRGYAASLPPEFAAFPEIAVSRRLFRDGTSEYLLNKTSVRLKDVTDLFLGTGVGSKAYSIVEQGRIGQIVTARPEDRRLFLEEAAGITKYKRHRRDAERKMDQTRQNLLRVSDILAEIDRTRSALKRQAAKAERFVEYREEFEDLTLHQNSHQLLELIVVERVEREALAAAEAASAEARTRVEEHEVGLAAARAEAAGIEARSDAAAQGAFRADNDVSSLQGELARSRDQLTHLDARLRAADSEKDAVGVRLAGLGAERDELEQRVVSLGDDAEARSDDARKEEEALVALRAEEATAEQAASGARAEVSELATAAAGGRARVEALGQRIQDLHRRRDRLASDLDRSREELSTLEAHEGALRRSVAERAEGKRLTGDELAALERELGALRPQSLEAERALDAAKNELGLKRSRLRALEDLHRRLEGVGTGVRALLSSGQEGVLGLVADRLEVAEAHTAALAGLLGDRLQCVVVRDPARGLELLDALRAQKRGRATVAPVSPPYVAGSLRGELPAELCLGRFADHVRHAPGDEGLVRTLLGDALLCRTAADALELARRVPGATAVALDGTVVRPDGVISGGSGDDVAAGMVEQKREMRHLGAEVAALEQRAEAALEHHRALRARIAELGTSLDRARAEARETEIAHVSAEKDLSRTVAEIGRERHRQGTLAAEVDELARAVEAAVNDEQTTRAQLDEVDQRLEAARAALARATEGATAWKERVAGQASLVMERRVRLAQLREQLEAARSQLERVSLALEENGERARRLEEESLQAAASFGEIAASLVLGRSRLADATEIASAARRHQDEMRRLLEEIRFALSEHEGRLRELRAALATSEEAGRTHGLRLQKLELAREHLLVGVRERFRGLNLHRVVGKYHARPAPDEAHRARLDELARLIERMGPVNLDAKAEYEDAERRFEALEKQKLDIEQALVDLERAIKHMNRESKRRFKETFDAVNDLFRRSFVEMFRGGRAELLLTNPEDLLETGVEIVAQPPGKRLGNIELMSGGEKALTAVALIFAIFRHRPSPFCVLDEVDAPLDEANVRRYNDAIRSMTDRSQFILITHIKSTMQSVDALYGVTMGEPGVSRLVSVKVNESAGNRSERRGALEAPAAETAPETRVTAVA